MPAFLTAWWRSPSRRRGAGLALVCFLATLGTWAGAVATLTGQRLESAALAGSRIGSHIVNDHARMLLHVVSMPAAIALVVVILLVGLVRGSRRRGWWAAGTVVAINASTQILKHWVLWRPDYGISLRPDGANTLPSGHTAVAASAAVALVLVAGNRWRPLAACLGVLVATAMGYSTLVTQWHRPADVIAAIILAVAWGGAAVAGGVWSDEREDRGEGDDGAEGAGRWAHPGPVPSLTGLFAVGWVCAAVTAVLGARAWMAVSGAVGSGAVGRADEFIAYAAGSTGTVAVACLGLAALAELSPARVRRS